MDYFFSRKDYIIIVGLEGRNICIDDDIDIINHHSPHSVNNNILSTVNEDFRLSLMANLYSTIEFMKKEIEEKKYLIRTLLEKLENCKSEFPNKDQLDSFCCEINKKCEDDVKTRSTNISTNITNVSSKYVTLSALSEINEISRVSSSTIQANDSKSPINSSFISNGNDSNDIRMVNESIISAINTSINKTPVEEQIINYRKYRHNNYINERTNSDSVIRIQTNEHINNQWPMNTILIASDSIMNNTDEKRLSKSVNVKVRAFARSTINDMYSYLEPLLRKEPSHILLHVGTNDSGVKSSEEIVSELLQLKSHVKGILPNCTIYILLPTLRTDNPYAARTICQLSTMLKELNIQIMNNDNITAEQLGKKGVQLNSWGISKLAMNINSLINQL